MFKTLKSRVVKVADLDCGDYIKHNDQLHRIGATGTYPDGTRVICAVPADKNAKSYVKLDRLHPDLNIVIYNKK